jgi:hypothetical protein
MKLKTLKDMARQAYKDQQLQDTEGGCGEPIGFVAGYLAGYRAAGVDDLLEENQKLKQKLEAVSERLYHITGEWE